MKSLGQDPSLLPVSLREDGALCVEDEPIGQIDGFRFIVDPLARHEDRKMLLAAGEKALPRILGIKARKLIGEGLDTLRLEKGMVLTGEHPVAKLEIGTNPAEARLTPVRELNVLTEADRTTLMTALERWLATKLEPLAPLAKMEAATHDADAGSQARAMLLTLIGGHGYVSREQAGIENLPKEMRPFLRRLGVTFGALDIFAPLLLKPAPRQLLHAMGVDKRPLQNAMIPVIDGTDRLPSGYRPAGAQHVRVDIAEKLVKAAHETRGKAEKKRFFIDPSLAISTGLTPDSFKRLLGASGFRNHPAKILGEGAFGPPSPDGWEWRPGRSGKPTGHRNRNARNKPAGKPKSRTPSAPREGNAFAALADLIR